MALGWWSSSEEEEEPREKCFVDYDSAATEDLKEHIKENCSKIEECYGDIKSQKEKFNLLKSQLAEYDEYVQLITDSVAPPEYFLEKLVEQQIKSMFFLGLVMRPMRQ